MPDCIGMDPEGYVSLIGRHNTEVKQNLWVGIKIVKHVQREMRGEPFIIMMKGNLVFHESATPRGRPPPVHSPTTGGGAVGFLKHFFHFINEHDDAAAVRWTAAVVEECRSNYAWQFLTVSRPDRLELSDNQCDLFRKGYKKFIAQQENF